MTLERLVPTMFHRRLLLLMVLVGAGAFGLGAQLSVLTVVRADELRASAEARLESVQWLPTVRGRILDRKGRVLAQDRPSFDLAVDYTVISGTWAEERAGERARRLHRSEWAELDQDERRELIERYAPLYQAHLDRAWGLIAAAAGVSRADLEERRRAVVDRVEHLARQVSLARERREVVKALARGQEITTELEDEIGRRAATRIREASTPQVVIPRITDRVGFELMRLAGERTDLMLADGATLEKDFPLVPGLEVVSAADREYPYDAMTVRIDRASFPSPIAAPDPIEVGVRGVLIHTLGWLGGSATDEDVKAREQLLASDPALADRAWITVGARRHDRGRYEASDPVGRYGLESAQEPVLRGLRGVRSIRYDTGADRTVGAEPGRDLRTTLDVYLAARVQALLDSAVGLAAVQPWHALATHDADGAIPGTDIGTPLYGAAVVLDIESGGILAMVSTPGFTREMLRAQPSQIAEDPFSPLVNRVIWGLYPPGSIAKAIVLAAAVSLGRHALAVPIPCNGHLLPHDPNSLRCWIFKRSQNDQEPMTHTRFLGHALDAREALMVSCNIYFYTLGRQLGVEGIRRAYEMFGVGSRWNLGVGRESPGEVAGAVELPGGQRRALAIGDAVQMGIGQGPVAWTPLHAADALATLARGGTRITPRLLADAPQVRTDLGLDPDAVRTALEGLSLSVNDRRGTGHHLTLSEGVQERIFNAPGVHVWGKTGTAAAPDLRDGTGPRTAIRRGDHSWFVVLAGPQGGAPRYAIAVLMEYAGSGGKVSGPICNQIIHALIAEGYL